MRIIFSPLKGVEKLWKVFWIYNVTLGLVLSFVLQVIGHLAILPLLYIFLLIGILWTIWILVGLWKCAFNTKWEGWGYLARAFVVLSILGLMVGLWEMRTFIAYHINIRFPPQIE